MTVTQKAKSILMLWLARITGGLFTLFGILGMLTPIPFGLFFFVIGLMFLIPSTPGAADLVRRARARFGLFDKVMSATSQRLPVPYRRILRQTDVRDY